MKKMISALLVCGTLLVATAPAQAAPQDPVRALKAKLVAGHGVHFTEIADWSDGTDTEQAYTNKGVLQFDAKKPAAYDIVSTAWDEEKDRVIYIDKTTYLSGALAEGLPKGKTWYKYKGGGGLPYLYGQILNPAESATLSALLRKGTTAGNKVTGKIAFKDLAKVSPWFSRSELSTWPGGTEVSYTLTLTSAGLVSKLWSSFTAKSVPDDYSDYEGSTFIVDTRYTGWGSKVSVKAPNPKTVTDKLTS
ncbi:hypothetical protein [Nonomuraea basaltis]|uniref:hypothetical protein n=1 Tax=Nonomuraea basaltis TaxID=2495887 RepID=UPI00110C5210|nr:hypothetical protein [Nonomuraea basaltis]TMR94760.1 hypothetical protein EJK15_32100 [Nonomuraea basaltis]